METSLSFVSAVLGKDGATALRRAILKNPALEGFLVPRTVLGWTMNKSEFRGALPGVDQIYIEFSKAESGYTGRIGVGKNPLVAINPKDEFELAAEIISNLGIEVSRFEGGASTLYRLGKSIDTLLKAREAIRSLAKAPQELPGTTAKPLAPEGPQEPIKPTATQPKIAKPKPKLPKLPMVKIELDNLNKHCKTCGSGLFKNQRFAGCLCWRDLAKHSVSTVYADGVVVEFDSKADRASVQTLLRELTNAESQK